MKRRKYPQITKKHACIGKKRYTRKQAASAARGLNASTGQRFSSYKCKYCNHFHAGHTPKAVRQIIDSR